MKKTKILYWVATGIVSLMMLYSGYLYLVSPDIAEGFVHLGFPNYFRVELGLAKIGGGILLLAPIKGRFNEWLYAGFTITFISAFVAHISAGDPLSKAIAPIVFLAILAGSYMAYHKLEEQKMAEN
ncbi:DoxX family protein [Rhodohalobacter sp. 614A]|uniref:DoxX family protein n=1 Tax=Rhodohalobacter sp. 614A TaxID=2908649 RepID=UPI001F38AE0C|nr:DoxX family protein [Rhodohalobacter sp. 614A]